MGLSLLGPYAHLPGIGRRPRVRSMAGIVALAALTFLVLALARPPTQLHATEQSAPPPGTYAAPAPSSPSPDISTELNKALNKALDKALEGALSDTDIPDSVDFSVAITELGSPLSAHYSTKDDRTFDTASIVKVDILTTLLLQHADTDTSLTPEEKRLAKAMITTSSNDATDTLWARIGGSEGLEAANATLGLTDTAGGVGGLWGLTQTTTTDQLLLLEAIFADNTELPAPAQSYLRSLMREVIPEQTWGIADAADPATDDDTGTYALKNGWLQRSTTDLWDINSIGLVEHDGRTLLIAILSDGHPTAADGIELTSQVAVTTARTFTDRS